MVVQQGLVLVAVVKSLRVNTHHTTGHFFHFQPPSLLKEWLQARKCPVVWSINLDKLGKIGILLGYFRIATNS